MALTDVSIRSAQSAEKPYKLFDAHGLFLLVTPSGGKLWRFKYRFLGVEKLLALGAYPIVTLREARERRDEARRQLSRGVDPSAERKLAKRNANEAAANSFKSVAEEFIAVRLEANGKANSTVGKAKYFLAQLGLIAQRPISQIEAAELLHELKKLEKQGKRETAQRTLNFASRVFRFGVASARCNHDPAALLKGALSAPVVKHRAAILDGDRLGEFLAAVESYPAEGVVKLAMRLLPHVFLRPGELRMGKWCEVDWGAKIWTIPAERTKLRRNHSVPLSSQVIRLLEELRSHSGGFDLMFPGKRSHLSPISENTLNNTYRRLGFGAEEVTAHGFRSTASTILNESGLWHPDAIERALAHGHSDAVRGIYARGQHWDERVSMAQWWSDYLDEIKGRALVGMKGY